MEATIQDLLRRQDWDAAAAACRQAVLAHPTNPTHHGLLGLCYFRMGRFQAAADSLRRAVILDPNYVDAGLKLAQSLDRLQRFAEAYEVASEFLRLRPADPTLQGLERALRERHAATRTEGWERTQRADVVKIRLASEDGEIYVTDLDGEEVPEEVARGGSFLRLASEGFGS